MKVTFKTGSEANYGSTNGELFFASNTKQIMLNGIKYIPKKLSELINDSGFITSITKSMVEGVLTGNITSHTHQYAASPSINGAATTLYGKYTYNGGRQNPDYFGKNKVGALMMNTTVNGNTQYKDWIISDCYTGNDAGGAVAFGVNREKLGAYIMRSASERTEWAESAELLGTHNYASYALPLSGGTLTGNLTCNGSYINMSGIGGAKGYSGYFNNPKRSDRASYSHILGDGYAYGEKSISIGAGAYAGIRNTDSDSDTYPYLHWQWMDCLQVKEVTSAGDVNCYGAILNNLGGTKDTAKFTVCVDGVCKFYDESKGDNDPTNQFLKFTNTDANFGRVVVFIVDNDATYNKGLIFGGTTEHPRRMCNLKIGNMILGQGCQIKDVASTTINKKTVYRLAIYWWNKKLSTLYDITKATTAMVCTKVDNSNYNGASSYASGYSSVASGFSSVASGSYSVASGYSSVASGSFSVASGYYSVASGNYSVASGSSSVASGSFSVASGYSSVASGYSSVASGFSSVASGSFSVASGNYSVAKHEGSKVYALRGISGVNYQTVLGRDNVETTGAVVVGWGSSDTNRKNIFVLDTTGNATFGSGGVASVTAATFNGNATTASKLATARKITIGSTYKSFDGSGDIEFALNSIITQRDTINVGTLNVASTTTISEGLTVGGNISGELANKLSITLGSTTTTYDNTGNKSINITPSAIGALENKFIVNKLDYQRYAILLCKIGTNTTKTAHTINGVFYSHSNGVGRYQAACVNIHSSNWSSSHNEYYGFTPFGLERKCRLVTCTYKGMQYLAITFENTQATNIYFDGSSVNILFTPILYYTENTQTINNPEIYNSIEDVVYHKTPIIISSETALTSSNYNSYSPKLDGTGAMGTWGISISGNAATATNAAEADMLTTTCNITIGNTTKAFNGSQSTRQWTLAEIGAAEASHTHSYIPLTDKGLSNGKVSYYVNFPAPSQLVSLGYNEESTKINDEYYFKGLCKWAIKNYANNGYILLMGVANPNSSGFCCIQLYSGSGKDKDTGLPRYCSGMYNGLNGVLVNFRCDEHIWYWKGYFGGNAYSASKWKTARTITLTGSVTGSVSIDGSANVSLVTTTNHTHSEYLPLSGGTLNGALTVPTLTSTGGIVLGDSSLSAMVGSVGIQRYDETGFIGFLKDFNLGNSFNGVVLGWDGNYQLSTNSVRIDASTFTYKGNSVLHSGNLGYTSSGLSRAVQKDASGNLFIVAPSLFEQGISNNYPKNLRWSNETEGQLVYDTEIEAGNFDTVEIGIPLADGTSKGFLKSTSTVTNVTGYTPCPVVSGTPYYKEDCLYLGSTEIGYTGIMEYGIQYTFNYGTKLPYLEDYTPDSIPRCVVLCFPDRSSNYRFLFWLSAFDEGDPYIARFYNSAYETWLTIDTASRQIILSYGNTWQS